MAKQNTAPRYTSIMGQPHMLAYINSDEEKLLRSRGGMGIAGPADIKAYPPDSAIAADYDAISGGGSSGSSNTGSNDDDGWGGGWSNSGGSVGGNSNSSNTGGYDEVGINVGNNSGSSGSSSSGSSSLSALSQRVRTSA